MNFAYASLLTLLLAVPVSAEEAPRRDGNWEVTVEIEVDGVPGRVPPRTITQCVSKEEAAEGKNALPHGDATQSSCTASDHKVEGNRVSWTFKCDAPKPMAGTGEIVYTDENSYTGTISLVRDGHSMVMKYSGKRLGDCPK